MADYNLRAGNTWFDTISDTILGLGLRKLSEESDTFAKVIGYFIYFSLGIGISKFTYKLRRIFLVLGISVINLFLFRFLILIVLVKTVLVNQSMIYPAIYGTVIEATIIFFTAVIFGFLLKFVETKFTFVFAEIHNIERDVRDHERGGKKCDIGVCGRCGAKIKIAKERAYVGETFGKRKIHFCDNCGIFLRDNPFDAMLLGLVELAVTLIFFIFCIGVTASQKGNLSMLQNALLLSLLFGMVDGARRLFSGVIGIIKSQKRHLDKTVL